MAIEAVTAGSRDTADVAVVLDEKSRQLAQAAEQDERQRPGYRRQLRTPEPWAVAEIDEQVG